MDASDATRRRRALLTTAEVGRIDGDVLDPSSLILSARVRLGTGNVFYPSVVIECDDASECVIGDGNVFWPGTVILAQSGGAIQIADANEFGPGGAAVKANAPGKANAAGNTIRIGSRCRPTNGAEILGQSDLGDGSQVLGAISALSVRLGAGADHTHAEPDERGAVLKGAGTARELVLRRGDVVNGVGDFGMAPVERQSHYHPRASR
ncbi:MAG TPA: hypothetical protein VH442_10245 [Micromonosporaceae bacterium]|jgi:hypothetical protein